MSTRALLHGRTVGLGIVLLTIAFQGSPSAQQGADPSIRVGASDLGGVVTSANGREAGVWVIGYGHVEGGKGTTSKVVKFQLRPDPLAR